MQKLTTPLKIRADPPQAGSPPWKWSDLVLSGQALARLTQVFFILIGLMLLTLLAWANTKANAPWGFEWLAIVICAGAAWFAGMPAAVLCVVFSTVCFYVAETGALGTGQPQGVLWWNVLARFLAFGGVAWLAAYTGRLSRELTGTVEDQTKRLQQEIEQHKDTVDTLGQTLQIFEQLTENIDDVFWVTDAQKAHVEYVSPAFEEVWGQSCRTVCVSPSVWLEGIHQEDRERVMQAAYAKQVRGEYDEEYRVVRPDGSVRWVHERAFPVRDESGAVYRLVGIAEDITERKRTEHLLQAERSVGLALSSTSDLKFALKRLLDIALQLEGIDCGGVYLADPETGELHLEVHRGLSRSFQERISHYKADATEARLAKAGRSVYIREEQIPRGLEVLWGSEGLRALAIVPVQNKGEILGVLNLGSYRQDDIPVRTRVGLELIASQVAGAIARIRAEESLRRSEAHLRTVINNAPVALLASDAAGRITLEDGHALAAMGVRAGEHVRQLATDVYRDHPLMLANVQRALAGEEFGSIVEFGSTTFDCRYAPLPGNDRQPAGFIAVATDVTERFRLQREILEISEREQARIGQDVHDGLCQQLIGAALKANSLAQTLTSAQHRDADSAGKLCGLLDEAITESRRVCRGLYPIRLRREGLVPALQELANSTSERHQVQCVCESPPRVPDCEVTTATHLYRIAQEAVNNAVKHSGGSRVVIRVYADDRSIIVEIKDNGTGLGHPAGPGSGMGLHIMEYRARLLGGTLRFEPGAQGTSVVCRVPRFDSRNSV